MDTRTCTYIRVYVIKDKTVLPHNAWPSFVARWMSIARVSESPRGPDFTLNATTEQLNRYYRTYDDIETWKARTEKQSLQKLI